MMLVIFEVTLKPGCLARYLEIAAELKAGLSDIAGFISVERFQSQVDPGRWLSLSCWENEAAVLAWRQQLSHREAQAEGRGQLFADYHLRVAEVVRDYSMSDGGMFGRGVSDRGMCDSGMSDEGPAPAGMSERAQSQGSH